VIKWHSLSLYDTPREIDFDKLIQAAVSPGHVSVRRIFSWFWCVWLSVLMLSVAWKGSSPKWHVNVSGGR